MVLSTCETAWAHGFEGPSPRGRTPARSSRTSQGLAAQKSDIVPIGNPVNMPSSSLIQFIFLCDDWPIEGFNFLKWCSDPDSLTLAHCARHSGAKQFR